MLLVAVLLAAACGTSAEPDRQSVVVDVDVSGLLRVAAIDGERVVVEATGPGDGNTYVVVDHVEATTTSIDTVRLAERICRNSRTVNLGPGATPGQIAVTVSCLGDRRSNHLVTTGVGFDGPAAAATVEDIFRAFVPVGAIESLSDGRYLIAVGGICNSLGIIDSDGGPVIQPTIVGLDDLDWSVYQGFEPGVCETREAGGFDDVSVSEDGQRIAVSIIERTGSGPPDPRTVRVGDIAGDTIEFGGPETAIPAGSGVELVGSCVVTITGAGPFAARVAAGEETVVLQLKPDAFPQDTTHAGHVLIIGSIRSGGSSLLEVVDLAKWCRVS